MLAIKKCSKCHFEKVADLFAKTQRTKDGLQAWCKECRAEYYLQNKENIAAQKKLYREANAAVIKKRNKFYRTANLEKCKARDAAYHAANKEKVALRDAKYRSANKEKINASERKDYAENRPIFLKRMADYARSNPGKINSLSAQRRAQKKQATPAWACRHSIERMYHAAQLLNKQLGQVHHVDHIVPLQSDLVCGLHVAHNLQILTATKNLSKKNLFWPDMPEKD